MKAAVCERYGPPEVVRIREVPAPAPAIHEVLVRAVATTVNSGDARLRAMRVPRGLSLPVRLNVGVTRPRQPVFGFDMSGRVEAVGEAVTSFQPGDRVVASRGFDLGCHAELVTVDEHDGRRYDVIMDNHGNAPYARVKGSLQPDGRLLAVIGDLWQMLAATRRKAVVGGTASMNAYDYRTLLLLAASGELKPVIDSVLPFAQIVEAHRRVDTGHKVGSVLLTLHSTP